MFLPHGICKRGEGQMHKDDQEGDGNSQSPLT